MEGTATPRITCAYLNSYVGKHVIVVGKVVQLRGDEAVIDADGNITAHLNRVRNLSPPPRHDLSRKHPLQGNLAGSKDTYTRIRERDRKLTTPIPRRPIFRRETACRSLAR